VCSNLPCSFFMCLSLIGSFWVISSAPFSILLVTSLTLLLFHCYILLFWFLEILLDSLLKITIYPVNFNRLLFLNHTFTSVFYSLNESPHLICFISSLQYLQYLWKSYSSAYYFY
jgi:hypothetical protein